MIARLLINMSPISKTGSVGAPARTPCRVLLVEDYPDTLATWSLGLRLAGYDVLTATEGNRAVEVATDAHPDVVVMDLELPGITGDEAARRLRRDPATADIPLIAATGTSHAVRLDAASRAGFDVILTKPCDTSQLVFEIERLLDRQGRGSGEQHSVSG